MEVAEALPIEIVERFDGIEIWETPDLFGTVFAASFDATPSTVDAEQFANEAWMMHDALEQQGYIGRHFFCVPISGEQTFQGHYEGPDGAVIVLEWPPGFDATVGNLYHNVFDDGASETMDDTDFRPMVPDQCLPPR